MNIWAGIVLAAVGSYLFRLLPLELLARIPTSDWLDRAGMLIAPVAFAALAASAVAGGGGAATETVARLVAIAVAAAVALVTRSTPATLGTGMAALWIASAVLPG